MHEQAQNQQRVIKRGYLAPAELLTRTKREENEKRKEIAGILKEEKLSKEKSEEVEENIKK